VTAVLPHKSRLEITDRHPRIARALWADMLVDAAVFREWLANIGRRSAYRRVAHLLCEVMMRLDAVGLAQSGSYELPVTQTELADALGLSTVHINRILQQIRGEGLITFRGNMLMVHEWERLKAAGNFDQAYLRLSGPPGEVA
jgi:CRP-like cAMP-binding protein